MQYLEDSTKIRNVIYLYSTNIILINCFQMDLMRSILAGETKAQQFLIHLMTRNFSGIFPKLACQTLITGERRYYNVLLLMSKKFLFRSILPSGKSTYTLLITTPIFIGCLETPLKIFCTLCVQDKANNFLISISKTTLSRFKIVFVYFPTGYCPIDRGSEVPTI